MTTPSQPATPARRLAVAALIVVLLLVGCAVIIWIYILPPPPTPPRQTASQSSNSPANTLVMNLNTSAQSPILLVTDGKTLTAGGIAGPQIVVQSWDCSTFKQLHSWRLPSSFANLQAISPDGTLIAVANVHGAIDIVRLSTSKTIQTLGSAQPHGAFSWDDQRYFEVSPNGGGGWVIQSGSRPNSFGTNAHMNAMAASPTGNSAVYGGQNGQTGVLLEERPNIAPFFNTGFIPPVSAVAYSLDGTKVICGCARGVCVVFNDASMKSIHRLRIRPIPAASVSAVALSYYGQSAAVAVGNTIYLFDVASGNLTARLVGHREPITGLCFIPISHRLASTSEDGTIRIWQLP
ncbi:MAG TPA: WD40 repeat domain-containing protein [Tepidisphaeraceae bacterium]|nr:WD40 repeat domain-containing protein [Tepidisphaeraceae bacterium]